MTEAETVKQEMTITHGGFTVTGREVYLEGGETVAGVSILLNGKSVGRILDKSLQAGVTLAKSLIDNGEVTSDGMRGKQ